MHLLANADGEFKLQVTFTWPFYVCLHVQPTLSAIAMHQVPYGARNIEAKTATVSWALDCKIAFRNTPTSLAQACLQ